MPENVKMIKAFTNLRFQSISLKMGNTPFPDISTEISYVDKL